VEAGQVLDVLHDSVRAELGLPAIPVVATASHDTAAAVAAVSAVSQKTAYLISGTWGLLGVEINSPIINSVVSSYGFVNQGGVERTIRLLHNSLNMWLLQQCHDAWGLGQGDQAWEKTVALAEHAEAFQAFIDVDHPSLLLPPKMPDAVRALCLASGQRLPIHHGDVTRVILESLAMKSRFLLDQLSECVGWRPEVLHIVGGGGRNKMLNQLIANAIGLPVVVGPSEASAIGNIIVQMIAMREIKNLEEGRAIMQFSFPSETYLPIENERDTWIEQYNRYLRLINRQG
jgi:sugar (pentulose or hexulose) kinase